MLLCGYCKAKFPESWLKMKDKAIYKKGKFFCCKMCLDEFEADEATSNFRGLVDGKLFRQT